MKKRLWGTVWVASFIMTIGIIGGMQNDTLTWGQATVGSIISLTALWIAGIGGGWIG